MGLHTDIIWWWCGPYHINNIYTNGKVSVWANCDYGSGCDWTTSFDPLPVGL